MTRILNHVRSNVVGYLALFVALGGTSYAAIGVSNHSITPVKLNPGSIGGYVRAWAGVNASGHVTASTPGVRVGAESSVAPGRYIVTWGARPSSACRAIGSVDLTGVASQPAPGYLLADAFSSRGRGEQSIAQTYNPQGLPAALPFDLELVCATPR